MRGQVKHILKGDAKAAAHGGKPGDPSTAAQSASAQDDSKAKKPAKLTAGQKKEKAAVKRRFERAVNELIESYLFDGEDLSREEAEKMVMDYALTHDGYFDEIDEAKQKGEYKTRKQYAAAQREEKETKFSFGGRNAEGVDLDALREAEQMEKDGESADAIRKRTGWFRGIDKKWRYEIDDSGMVYSRRGDLNFRKEVPGYNRYRELTEKAERFLLGESDRWLTDAEQDELSALQKEWSQYFKKDGMLTENSFAPRTRLSDYFQHDELFKAYPQMENMLLLWDKFTDGTRGSYNPKQNSITLDESLRHAPEDTVIHEIQHAIQAAEGFTPGASVDYWMRNGEAVRADDAKDYYRDTAGEIEARDVTARRRMDREQRKKTPPDLGDENTVFAYGAGPSYSIKNTRGMTWKKQTDSYFGGKLKSSDSLYLGNSGKYVRGISSSPLYIPTSIVTKAMRPQKGSRSAHAMTENDIRGLEKGIREAPAVIYNPDRNALIYIAQEAEKGGQVVATFDLNNDLFGESAHKATSIHPRESIIPMLEKLGKDAVIYVQNENKFNELAGLQSDNPPKLLARVELVGDSLTDSGTESKGKMQTWDEEYSTAVKSGDMDTAQALVNRAAEAAMPESKIRTPDGKLRVVYHGTNSGGFTVFDPAYIGSANDVGYFGRGFYFAYDSREARMYGKNVMPVFLDIKNPFNFQTELNTLDGYRSRDYNGGRVTAIINFAEKFPEIAKSKTVTIYDNEKGEGRKLSFPEFAEAFRREMDKVSFDVQEISSDDYGKEWLVTAGKHTESYTNSDGETFSWDEYDYQQRYTDEASANDRVANTYNYLKETKWSFAELPATPVFIMESEFTAELKKRGYDGVIQSEEGDEVVAFESSQIKSADPVTYDDNGEVIPLSERFDSSKGDIRYSERNDHKHRPLVASENNLRYTNADDAPSDFEMSVFNRQLANMTNPMKDGEQKTIHINTGRRWYLIDADGYMSGEVLKSIPIDGNEDLINEIVQEVRNGTYRRGSTSNPVSEGMQDEGARNRGNNALPGNRAEQERNGEVDRFEGETDTTGDYEKNFGYHSFEELREAINSGAMVMDDNGNIIPKFSMRDNARTDRELLMESENEALTQAERQALEKYRIGKKNIPACRGECPDRPGCFSAYTLRRRRSFCVRRTARRWRRPSERCRSRL